MRKSNTGYQFSATDLSIYLSCGHALRLDKELLDGKRTKAEIMNRDFFTVQQLGNEHETRFVEHLKARGFKVFEFAETDERHNRVQRTAEAMKHGYDYIIQASFENATWQGRADVLMKVEKPSSLGPWSYEVMDTKLAQETKGGMILQLCVYSDLLSEIQGIMPDHIHVVKPGDRLLKPDDPFLYDKYRVDDFSAYYRWIKNKLVQAVDVMDATSSYPEPVPYCDTCKWWLVCDKRRRDDDHLSFVAGLQRGHARELAEQNLNALETFSLAKEIQKPSKGNIDTYQRLQLQAKIQYDQRTSQQLKHDILPITPGEGLSRLPEPDEGDVFFDIEGDRFYTDGSIEYLLGLYYFDHGEWIYRAIWALDRTQERHAFDALMRFLTERMNTYPGLHIYHFGHYETSAVKHMMLRHSIWAEELDELLRGEKFIDLHSILKQSIRAGVEDYGLKKMEPYYGFTRKIDLSVASRSLRHLQRALELDLINEIQDHDKEIVSSYNEDDCRSTRVFRDWLEAVRKERIDTGDTIDRPTPKQTDAPEDTAERQANIQRVFNALHTLLPDDPEEPSPSHAQIRLLADLLDYFRREEKNYWWEFYRINGLQEDELADERRAITGLEFIMELPREKNERVPRQMYRYPAQEFSGSEGDLLTRITPLDDERVDIGTIVAHDLSDRTIKIQKRGASAAVHPSAVQIHDFISGKHIEKALLRFAENICEDGIEGIDKFIAGRHLLFRHLPQFNEGIIGIVDHEHENILDSAIRSGSELLSSVLAIQGPPGSGKTYTGASMICALHTNRKRIGVTAVSHKAIDNLLEMVDHIAREKSQDVPLGHRDSPDDKRLASIENIAANKVIENLDAQFVVGATAFTWVREDLQEQLDYLFVDEAGQMSLAYVLAISGCAKNLILLGDPQQLDQPQKAAHPGGADISALQHYIGLEHQTIEPERGLFIGITRRLHPVICEFTSKIYYEGKLKSMPGLEAQLIRGNPFFGKQQLVYAPVEHSGNSNHSPEEVDAIVDIVRKLLTIGTTWIEADSSGSKSSDLTENDIMIIAPYNAQVSALKRKLPNLPIGTVDKFQGQEAAVVIYSMTSSSAEDAPRGMSFLYQPNRLNVASSRARCLFILVASPKLLEPECKTPEQMKWANGLCAFREMT